MKVLRAQLYEKERQEREAKLAEQWLTKADWVLDYDQVRSTAAAEGVSLWWSGVRSRVFPL